VRELAEELGVVARTLRPFAEVSEIAALERVPMRMTVFLADMKESRKPGTKSQTSPG